MATAAARRYARAIFELAFEEGQVEQWVTRLSAVRQVLTDEQARTVLDNPTVPAERREEVVAAILGDRAGTEGLNLARLLVGAGRIDDLDGIIEEYDRLVDDAEGRVRATAVTAVELDRAEADRLGEELSRRLGREVRLETRVDPGIVGGLVVRVGDRVIDASVATRLQQLRRRLAAV